jgi:hypothetical protein
MHCVETLLEQYIEEHRNGGTADPLEYLSRVPTERRSELAAMIDGYLARAPRAPLGQQPSPDPRSEATVEALSRSIEGAAGLWPALLPRLRDRVGLKRRELVKQLAAMLGVSDRQEKVARYYHEMELGALPAAGVSDRVLEALSKLVGTTVAELREAGAALGSGPGAGAEAMVFTRLAPDDAASAPPPDDSAMQGDEQWDEVDEMFRGTF